MSKRIVIATLLALALATAASAEIEIGLGIAPPIGEVPEGASSGGFFGDATKIGHVGYSFAWLFYASYDSFVLPPYAVSQMTGKIDVGTGSWLPGYFKPGFLSTINFGIRPSIGPIIITSSVGFNSLYVYRQKEEGLDRPPMGVNFRMGAGLRFGKIFGLVASGTTVFGSFDELTSTFKALGDPDPYVQGLAQDRILSNLFPSVILSIYL